ncbi:MAG TPA: FecR domain-containing protein [Fervidobacterium sp.]|nr:FecR domain-containing protein [Fervidobacterium sp.]HOM74233.1 FecR domain-containing protein [Fervidobacterium sp.]
MKKVLVFITLVISLLVLADFTISVPSETVSFGSKLPVTIEFTDSSGRPVPFTLKAKVTLGGFDKPEVFTKGIEANGKITINYLVPKKKGDVTLTFTGEAKGSKESLTKQVTLNVVEEDETVFSEKLNAAIDSFKGSVALKKEGKKTWESVKASSKIQEGDEILTLEKSYAIVKFPDGSMTKISENTQVLFEKLRQSKDGKILVSIVIQKGGTYNVVQKIVTGSSFEVKAGSVTAGVRGTAFGVDYTDEKPVVKVWEGEVFAFFGDAFVIPVVEGQQIMYQEMAEPIEEMDILLENTKIELLEEPLPAMEEPIEQPPIEEEKPVVEGPKEEPAEEPTPKPQVVEPVAATTSKAYIPPLGVETIRKDTSNYIVYSISPEFSIGPVDLGIGLTVYATEVGGALYYGVPSTNPSTNIINMITINSVALKLDNFYFRYGNMPMTSLAMGFSVRDYFKPYAKSFDVKTAVGSFSLMAHLPYELTKLWPFEFTQSDDVIAGEVEIKSLFAGLDLGLSALYDTQVSTANTVDSATPVNLSVSTFLRYPLMSNFYLGTEFSSQILSDFSGYGFGLFGGISGRVSIFDIVAGVYGTWNGFKPFYFGRLYTNDKLQNKLTSLTQGESVFGLLAGFNFYTDYAVGRLYLYGDFTNDWDALGEIRITIPQVGAIAGLFMYGYYYDTTPFAEGEMFDSDTISYLRITYPIMEKTLVAGMVYSWDYIQKSWVQSVYIGSETSW